MNEIKLENNEIVLWKKLANSIRQKWVKIYKWHNDELYLIIWSIDLDIFESKILNNEELDTFEKMSEFLMEYYDSIIIDYYDSNLNHTIPKYERNSIDRFIEINPADNKILSSNDIIKSLEIWWLVAYYKNDDEQLLLSWLNISDAVDLIDELYEKNPKLSIDELGEILSNQYGWVLIHLDSGEVF